MFFDIKLLTILVVVSPAMVMGQQPGTLTPEVHPPLTWQKCQKGGHCSTVHGAIVMDSEFRWVHNSKGENCFTGDKWNPTICPDAVTCAKNCAVDGVQYQSTFGVSTSGSEVRLNFLTNNAVGSRFYLLANQTNYEMFSLLAQEFTFDVDMSTLPCGMNGALYFVSMESDGGASKYPTNKAGAKYGTGYCDAQCPKGMKFMQGQANLDNGKHGLCCGEMDIWEANSEVTAFTAHPCTINANHKCIGDACGAASCDTSGCDYNPYRMGNTSLYGPGKIVDTKKVLTVVTQFITSDGTPHGTLTDIRRFYVQGGRVIPNSLSTVAGVAGNSMSDEFCAQKKKVFKDWDNFTKHGGLKNMGQAIKEGMVLAFSLWEDAGGNMLWLDGTLPKDSTAPGAARGPCSSTSGTPAELHSKYAKSYMAISNIKIGPINSTFGH